MRSKTMSCALTTRIFTKSQAQFGVALQLFQHSPIVGEPYHCAHKGYIKIYLHELIDVCEVGSMITLILFPERETRNRCMELKLY